MVAGEKLVWPDRGTSCLCLVLCKNLLVGISTFLRRLKISLDLAELGQVEGSDLLGLLNLLLVALHLVLQLVNQLLHPLVVLVVLLLRECELLDAPSSTALRLFSLDKTALLVVELGLPM